MDGRYATMVERYGRDAARIVRERVAVAEEYGDHSEAGAWHEIADIADRITRRSDRRALIAR